MTECRWCGMIHGPRCPEVKAIEYFQDGTVKRVAAACALVNGIPVIPPSNPAAAPVVATKTTLPAA